MLTKNPSQTTNVLVMVRPDQFGFNPETAETNVFQNTPDATGLTPRQIRDIAVKEFDKMVKKLQAHDLDIVVLPNKKNVITPDAVFPNNWFSYHSGGVLQLYPMLAPNRRLERQPEILIQKLKKKKINITKAIDLTQLEKQKIFLEGTGSLVLDRANKTAFAMESPRTHKKAFVMWCEKMGYEGFFFHAYDKKSLPIYHTNVVMSIGEKFAVYCPQSIKDSKECKAFEKKLTDLGKELIPVTISQLYSFCANILQVSTKKAEPKIILSQTAYKAFTPTQRKTLATYGELVPVIIPTIEKIGGGSARCMLAEIFV